MSEKLKITGRVQHGRMVEGVKQRLVIAPGTVIPLPDREYGLTDADIDRIVRGNCGVIVNPEIEAAAPVEEEDQANGIDDARIVELVAAIEQLEPGNPDHWTQDDKPEVAALKELTGGKVTAADRDAAWKAYKDVGNE